jgi:hypothetical protein
MKHDHGRSATTATPIVPVATHFSGVILPVSASGLSRVLVDFVHDRPLSVTESTAEYPHRLASPPHG